MSYQRNNQTKYTMKERYNYHKQIANSGKKDGKQISMQSRVNHANRAASINRQMTRYMNVYNSTKKR